MPNPYIFVIFVITSAAWPSCSTPGERLPPAGPLWPLLAAWSASGPSG